MLLRTSLYPLDVSTTSFPWIQFHKQNGWVKGKAICKDFGCKISNCRTILLSPDVPASNPTTCQWGAAAPRAWFCSRGPYSRINSDCFWPGNCGRRPQCPVVNLSPHGTICQRCQPTPIVPDAGPVLGWRCVVPLPATAENEVDKTGYHKGKVLQLEDCPSSTT